MLPKALCPRDRSGLARRCACPSGRGPLAPPSAQSLDVGVPARLRSQLHASGCPLLQLQN